MLTIRGGKQRFCDGISRREFLKIGGLALGGLALTDVLAAEAQAGIRNSHKAIIMIYLPGGPPHQDMFDLKMDAPAEIRGECKPMKTNVPGIEISDLMPKIAGMMDKFAIIRSLVGARDEHAASICQSGYTMAETAQNHAPSLGSVVSKLQGPVDKTVPAFVGLAPKMGHMEWADPGDPGFLGLEHKALQPDGQLMSDMVLNGISLDRLRDRRAMLTSMDRFRREADSLNGMDALNQRAFDLLTSHKLVEALDVTKEDPKVRERYGKGTNANVDDGGPDWNDQFLIARRLVEAGARCVTLAFGRTTMTATLPSLKSTCPVWTRQSAPWCRTSTAGAWIKTSPWWSGVSLDAPRVSTKMADAITGRASPAPFSPAAGCAPDRSSARPTALAKRPMSARSTTKMSSPPSIATWESTSRTPPSPTNWAVRTICWKITTPSPN